MSEYLTEQEQIELFKNWLKQYSGVILAGVTLALLTTFAYRYWQERQLKQSTHASQQYDEMLTLRAQNNNETVLLQANTLLKNDASTPYAPMAALMLARDAIIKKNYTEAEKQLSWVMNKANDDSIRQIARIRLARLMMAIQKPETSLELLNKVDDKNFKSLTEEIKGDAYLSLKKPALARQAYKEALIGLPSADVMRPLLQMKYDNLTS